MQSGRRRQTATGWWYVADAAVFRFMMHCWNSDFQGSSAEPELLWKTKEKSFIMPILMRSTEKAVLTI